MIRSVRSLVSLGTEKMLIDFGKGSLLAKARSQPDKVKQVLQKIKTDGLSATIDSVRAKLDSPIPLGYSNVGEVLETDADSRFKVGDRVLSNGPHAEVVCVPENLAAMIPDSVDDETASFSVVGAIGLQGIRLAEPTLGESFVVSGLGLIGLMTVQLLRAHGCNVLGIDFDEKKLRLAQSYGAQVVDLSKGVDPVRVAEQWTNSTGVDGVIITASTKSNDLIHQVATMCRKRARIVLVGVIGLNLRRSDFYEKELSFQVSCSYGPGRYDPTYEEQGLDYPIGFVRWTEQRNFQAILQQMADGKLETQSLVTHRFGFDDALNGYDKISDPNAMGIVLSYPPKETPVLTERTTRTLPSTGSAECTVAGKSGKIGVGVIGAGGFASRLLIPMLPTDSIRRKTVVSSGGVSAAHAAKKFGFEKASTDTNVVFEDDGVNCVFICTPHFTHADLVCKSLEHGKHVFVEKPLALTDDQLKQIENVFDRHPESRLTIGFNRRFSPHIQWIVEKLKGAPDPKSVIMTVNAGFIPADHWTQDRQNGGGRIIGKLATLSTSPVF